MNDSAERIKLTNTESKFGIDEDCEKNPRSYANRITHKDE